MTLQTEADTFVNDPNTTPARLGLGCELLEADHPDTAHALRAQLNEQLSRFETGSEIASLNPAPPKKQ